MSKKFSDEELMHWADFLRGYAENWDEHFKKYGDFFTQEFWYLFVAVAQAFWAKIPLNVSAAKAEIRGLAGRDDKVKDARIMAAVEAGLIVKLEYDDLDPQIREKLGNVDKRFTYLIPTTRLEKEIREHLSTTLAANYETYNFTPK